LPQSEQAKMKKPADASFPGFWHFEETVISLMAVFL
jgi:hypothetical protein